MKNNEKENWFCTAKEEYCNAIKNCELFESKKSQEMKFTIRCQHCFFLTEGNIENESTV